MLWFCHSNDSFIVIDEPNTLNQGDANLAEIMTRKIYEEILPYMNIYPDEELKGTNANLDITGTDAYFMGERDGDYLPSNVGETIEDVEENKEEAPEQP